VIESQNMEFKESWKDANLKTICAFSNSSGGILKVGVSDKGEPTGVTNAKRLLRELPNKIRNKLGIIAEITLEKEGGKDIVVIEVIPSSVPISYNGRYYTRSGSNTFELAGDELPRLLIEKTGRSWDEYIEERATFDDIDTITVEKFKTMAAGRLPSIGAEDEPAVILEKLNLTEGTKLKKAALLLFGKNPRKFYL